VIAFFGGCFLKYLGWTLLLILFWMGMWGIITVFFAEVTGLIILHAALIALVFTSLAYLVSDTWMKKS
jgi:hypothetical protein